ncbi:MAG: hypothetical protein AABZ60_21845, partial [Planctomycetota bacterium]
INDRTLYVSPLINIKQFLEFLENSGYQQVGYGDPWETVNDEDEKLPVCVSWFDANAYIAWYEKKFNLPVKLLKIQEYLKIHPGANPVSNRNEDVKILKDPKFSGTVINGLEHWIMKFGNNLQWRKNSQGLSFLISPCFGEWLFEYHNASEIDNVVASAVNTNDLCGIRGLGAPVERDFFPATSVGKYKYCKIGFRLCYFGENE